MRLVLNVIKKALVLRGLFLFVVNDMHHRLAYDL